MIKTDFDNLIEAIEQSRFTCEKCDRWFGDVGSYDEHVETHNCNNEPSGFFKCLICDKSFKYKHLLQRHSYKHTSLHRHECKTCSKPFASLQLLKIHSQNCWHSSNFDESNNPINSTDDMLDEESLVADGRVENGVALVEGNSPLQIFADEITMDEMMDGGTDDFDTSDFIQIFSCQFCGKTFSQASHLRAHVVWHTGSRLYKCLLCDFSFNRLDHLKRHINTHRGLKPVKELPEDDCEEADRVLCPICSKEFKREEQMQRHVRNNHETEPRFKCNKCGSKFKDENKLKKHVVWHGNYRGRGFKCPICPSCFRYPSFLMHHVRVHSNERPFPCPSCSKTFKQRSHLKRHMELHSRDHAFCCEFCGQSFGSDKILQSHVACKCAFRITNYEQDGEEEEEESYYRRNDKRVRKSMFHRNDSVVIVEEGMNNQQLVPNVLEHEQDLFNIVAA